MTRLRARHEVIRWVSAATSTLHTLHRKTPLFRFGETLDINLAQLDKEIGFIPMSKRETWRWIQIIWSSRMHG